MIAPNRSYSRLAWPPESSKPCGSDLEGTIALIGERWHKLIEEAKERDRESGKGGQ
ncbi:hypothetical protein MPNT_520009 [Candidatus Methylacidithermus pantelleriae]|uniref:Uncharacterized protein n=1 Tax=Candidatus Methylacidithermus pantelleriae TaxID=2744239 RepID=A0A8J2BP18_9BACT|nr:hypothetical protein MPNT_520009 [Candidatus Methylacidithermus pantelleriae]